MSSTSLTGPELRVVIFAFGLLMLFVSTFRAWRTEHHAKLAADPSLRMRELLKAEFEERMSRLSERDQKALEDLIINGRVHDITTGLAVERLSLATKFVDRFNGSINPQFKPFLDEWVVQRRRS